MFVAILLNVITLTIAATCGDNDNEAPDWPDW